MVDHERSDGLSGLAVDTRDLSVSVEDLQLLPPTTLAVKRGESVALVGANGSGKTTLLRVVAGILPPTSGDAVVFGRTPNERSAEHRAAVGALIGPPPLARNLTLAEQLELIAISWGSGGPAARERASGLLQEFRITHLAQRFLYELSSGQRQLYALCATLIRPADLLLLDEPEQRLDGVHRAVLAESIRARVAAGTAVLMATHSPELISSSGARVATLGGGAE